MRLYRPAYTKPVPAGAKTKRDKNGPYVTIRDRSGQPKKCRLKETAKGKRMVVESSHYTLVFRDHTGTERRLKGHRERSETDVFAKLVGQLVYHVERGNSLPPDLQEWADALPDAVHKRLAGFGLVRPRHTEYGAGSQCLKELTADFAEHLRTWRNDTERHVRETLAALHRLFDACGFEQFSDIDPVVLERHLTDLRKNGRGWNGTRGLSVRTVNRFLRAAQQFTRWAVKKRKVAHSNPLDSLDDLPSTELDLRRKRRALTRSEIFRLLRATAQGPERHGLSGRERCLLYRMGFTSGLRANELRCLKVRDFDFDDPDGATVTVQAAYSKTRKRAVQPLDPELARDLRQFVTDQEKQPGGFVFNGRYVRLTVNTAKMVREDAEAAGLQYTNENGTLDFHSLRHTFTSSLEGDDSAKQSLTRHATRAMLDRYDHRDALRAKRDVLARVKQWGVAG